MNNITKSTKDVKEFCLETKKQKKKKQKKNKWLNLIVRVKKVTLQAKQENKT